MDNLALFARLEAKPGKEVEVASFLEEQLAFAQGEPGTTSWFAIRLGARSFAIFDTFADESGRQAHLSGQIAEHLKAMAPDLLASAPVIEKVEILAEKLPGTYEVPDSLG
jgi:quinol monooxygenase YgiN